MANAGSVTINSPTDGQVFSINDNVDIEISGSADIQTIYSTVPINIDSTYLGVQSGNTASFDYQDPNHTGTVKIFAFGIDAAGEIVVDSTFIHICDSSLNLTLPEYSSGSYNSDDVITATGVVSDEAIVLFEAANAVNLLPNFEVEIPATFTATIGDCDNTNNLIEDIPEDVKNE